MKPKDRMKLINEISRVNQLIVKIEKLEVSEYFVKTEDYFEEIPSKELERLNNRWKSTSA